MSSVLANSCLHQSYTGSPAIRGPHWNSLTDSEHCVCLQICKQSARTMIMMQADNWQASDAQAMQAERKCLVSG